MKNKHQRAFALLFALLLAIGLTATSLAFTSAIQPLSGNVSIEPAIPEYTFTEQITVTDGIGDVGVPDECKPTGTPGGPADDGMTGWDIDETAFTYDRENDTLYVGVSMANGVIAGDPDNNGNASNAHSCLSGLGGVDIANLGGTEGIDVIFDTNLDGSYDYIAGMAQGTDITALQVATYNGNATPTTDIGLGYNAAVGGVSAILPNNPNGTAPDFEYQITGFSGLFAGLGNGDTLSFCFISRAGSLADAGFGEDILPEAGCEEVTFEAQYDFGDLPGSGYGTALVDNGARHIIDGSTYLGAAIDAETDGISDILALGDDNNNTDDEDGVTFTTALIPGGLAELEVVASTNGYLNAWLDWDGDNDFTADDQIITSSLLVPGINIVNFAVPATVATETLYARFRFTTNTGQGNSSNGVALNGEVEDYALMSLGDIVWLDNGAGAGIKNNGILDGAEAGVPNVIVELYRGTTSMGTTTTDANGNYFFYGLQPGSYSVRVRSTNFATNQPLDDHISSLGNGTPNDDADQGVDENGLDNAAPATNGIRSGSMTLALGTEPDTNSNPTLDFGFVEFTPTLQLEKTVYLGGNDLGAGCVAGNGSDLVQATNGTSVTYCFEVTNTSTDVWLNNITLDDTDLGIDQNDMEVPTNTTNLPSLAPMTGTNYYYYVTTIDGDLENTATAEGQPATSSGQALIGLPDVTDTDSAEVDEVSPSLELQKTVYFGDGNSCPGEELVTNINAADITYCLEITNTGDTYLDNFTLTDTLGITLTHLALSSGVKPLAPAQSLVYYYESEISGTLKNTAMITATATDDSGTALTQAIVVSDTDTAQVVEITPSVQIQKTVYQGHDNGASCADGELVTDVNGANVTYCFTVTNDSAGNYLEISLSDTDLGITDANMELLSGNLPLVLGGGQAVYYYEATMNGDLLNTATVTGNPVDSSNNDYPNVANVTDNDTAQVDEVAPAIDIQKTVYVGNNSGASCPGSDLVNDINGEVITYCFQVTNEGDTYLNNITITDTDLGITNTHMTWMSGGMPLTPSMSLSYYYTTTLGGDLLNTATVEGDPSDADGTDYPGITNVTDSDTAEVNEVAPAVEIAKTVYLNIDNGASCPTSGEVVIGLNGNAITYCFVVTNTGDTYLDDIDLDDNDLGLDEADMTWLSGSMPLAPTESLVYYYETTILMDLVNTASVEANPSEADGTDLVGVPQQTFTDTAVVDQVSPNITLNKTVSLGAYAGGGASCRGSQSVAATNGDDVTYCFQVTNTGDTYLNISLTDNPLGISLVDMTLISGTLPLAKGASLEYYYEAEVNGDLVNVAEVIGNPVDDNFIDLPNIPDVSDQDTAEVDEVSPGINLEKTVYLGHNGGAFCQGDEVVTGRANASITYCFEVTNTSDTYLDVSLDDGTLGITEQNMLPVFSTPLAPGGASRTYFYQTTISADLINIATATGNPVDANGNDLDGLADVDDSNSAEVVLATAAVTLNKTVYAGVDSGASCAGFDLIVAEDNDAITYCFQVTNTGNTYLIDLTIDDSDIGIDEGNMTWLTGTLPLAPGASFTYYYQTFVNGGLVNTAEATANPSDENGNDLVGIPNVTYDDTATVSQAAPAIEIQKTVAAGANAACPGAEIVTGEDGDPVIYCFVMTNTGDTYLNDVMFRDPALIGDQVIPLGGPHAPNATRAFTIGATINGSLLNTAFVEGTPTDQNGNDLEGLDNVSDEDTASVGDAGLTLAKTVGVGHPQTGIICPADELGTGTAGTAIFFCFEVTNSGSTYLSNLQIDDAQLDITITDMTRLRGVLPLAPGETIAYYYKSLITTGIVNSATARANPIDENGNDLPNVADVTNSDTATVVVVQSPDIALHKTVYASHDSGATCPESPESGIEFVNGLPGAAITYCFEVENTGDTYLHNITVNDTNLGITQANMTPLTGTTPLAAGESLFYYYETTLDGDLVNTADVVGTPTDQNGVAIIGLTDVTDSDTATVEEASSPDVRLAKTVYSGNDAGVSCPGGELVEGVLNASIIYCFEVENTGDTYLASITISDTLLGITEANMTPLSGTTPLAPGASLVYYYQSTITVDMVNEATVDANPSDQNGDDLPALSNVTDSDTAQVNEVSSQVEIHKTVYLGQDQDAGASCPGFEFVEGAQNALMTYCFEIENRGETYLGDIIITDDPLSITQDAMTLVISGSVPIAPGESAVYYYETTVQEDLINTAEVDANPTDQDGNDIAELANVTDSDTAQISANIPTALGLMDLTANQEESVSSAEYWQRSGYSLAVLLVLLAAAVALVYKTILSKQTE